jgi:hypothetical protein
MRDRKRPTAISGVRTTYMPVMKPVLDTVVRWSPAVCSAYPPASSNPSRAPAPMPERPRLRTRDAAGTASVKLAIANRTARKANSG